MTNDGRFRSEEAIFAAAVALPPAERLAYLNEACGDNVALRQGVQALLQSHAEATGFLEQPVADTELARAAFQSVCLTEKIGDKIGRYKLLQQIGEGGCGIVYMAEQQEPVRRQVALKIIKLGMDTKQVIARFEAERQALALMDHPNIAKVLDAGAAATGRPYFVMELVRGIKITEFCDKNQFTTEERLKLFIRVCQAVQHAHQKGIIHRDLKPSNILVTLNDGVPLPKVIDFGIAKATQERLTEKTLFTAFEQLIGTPAYMSPEQAEMNAQGVDTRSDIYSLGVLLYELLTGRTPFELQELLQAGVNEIRRIIREEEPQKPSTRLSTLLAGELTTTATLRHTKAPQLIHTLRGDLDWIVMKSLEKDRNRRYETASGFGRDVERYLAHEPITARPPSKLYEFEKTVRRHWFGFVATTAVILALVAGMAISTGEAVRARRAEQEQIRLRQQAEEAKRNETQLRTRAEADEGRATVEAAKSQQVARFLKDMLEGVGPSVALGRDTTMLREILEKTARRVGTDLTNQPLVEAELQTSMGDVYDAMSAWPEAEAMQRQALALRRAILGTEDIAVANSLQRVGSVLQHEGKNDEAETVLRQALAIREKLQGEANLDAARALNDLAWVLEHLNRMEEAEAVCRHAVQIQRKIAGEENLEVAGSLSQLCYILYYRSSASAAESYGRQSLAIRRKLLGSNDPEVAESCRLLAIALDGYASAASEEGNFGLSKIKFDEAEALTREAIAIEKKALGEENPKTMEARGDLALILLNQGKVEEAKAKIQECVEFGRKRSAMGPGWESADFAWDLEILGVACLDNRHLPEAKSLELESLALHDRHPDWNVHTERHTIQYLGQILTELDGSAETFYRQRLQYVRQIGDKRRVCETLFAFGNYLWKTNKLAEAEACFREMTELHQSLCASDAPFSRQNTEAFSGILMAERKYDQAEAFLRKALDLAQKYYAGEPHMDIAWLEIRLATALWTENKFDEAKSLARNSVALSDSHPDWTIDAGFWGHNMLGQILADSGDLPGAEAAYRRTLELQQSLQPRNPGFVADSLNNLGATLKAESKFAEAEAVYRERLAWLQSSPGTNSAAITANLSALAMVLDKEGKTNDSELVRRHIQPAPQK